MHTNNILAIESCFQKCSMCFYANNKKFFMLEENSNIQTESLPIMFSSILEESKTLSKQISCVVVNVGPGSFTGIRIGIAFALGIVTPLEIPLYAQSSNEIASHLFESKQTAIRAIGNSYYLQTKEETLHVPKSQIPQNAYILDDFSPVTASIMIDLFLNSTPKEYTEPNYVRPVNAAIAQPKIIKP